MSKASTDITAQPLNAEEGLEDPDNDEESNVSASKAFGQLLEHIGDGGKFQWRVFFVASFCGIFFAFNSLAAAFLAAEPNFRCDYQHLGSLTNGTVHLSQPLGNATDEWSSPKCVYYEGPIEPYLPGSNSSSIHLQKFECEAWIYDDSVYSSTIVTEWNLVCDKSWMRTSAQAIYMAGVLVGAIVLSELSDMYGRRTISLVSAVGFIISGVCIAFSVNFLMFIVLRFFVAFFGSGMFLPNFVIMMEYVGPRTRTTMGMMYQGFFGVGFCLLPGIAYFIRDWRNLQLAISVPSVLLLCYFKWLPESPRWLLSQEREEEALKIFREMAAMNGRDMPEPKMLQGLLDRIEKHDKHSQGLLRKIGKFFKNQASLLRTPILRRRCLIIFFSWFVVSLVYYGLTFSGSNINASVYLMVFLSGVVEIPSYILACLTTERFGRRINIAVCFIVCGIACTLILAVPKEMVWLNLTLASVGKFFNSIAFAIAYIYSAELVPTKVRNIAVGTSSMWARVGSTIAPFIVDSLGKVHYAIPSTVFGVLSLLAGLFDLLLPETGKSPLPETIEEVESMKL